MQGCYVTAWDNCRGIATLICLLIKIATEIIVTVLVIITRGGLG